MAYEKTKALNPFYRDRLGCTLQFPDIGQFPVAIIQWAATASSLDIKELHALFTRIGATGLNSVQEQALKRMLEVIVLTNRVLQPTNVALTESEGQWVRQALNQILSTAASEAYLINAALILMRLNAVEEAVAYIESNWKFLERSPVIRNLMGFIATVEGNNKKALEYFTPIQHLNPAALPFMDLSVMSAQFAQGMLPTQPTQFSSLEHRHKTFEPDPAVLPAIQWAKPLGECNKTIIIVACDDAYFFEHAIPFACSLHATNADTLALHLHLYSPSKSVLAEAQRLAEWLPGLQLAITYEEVPEKYSSDKPVYYACVRFVRSYELLVHYEKPVCLIDADALLRSDWNTYCTKANITDETGIAAICIENAPPWERIIAGFHYVAPTKRGKTFAADVAAFVHANFASGTLRWFLDQIALSSVYEKYAKGEDYMRELSADTVDLQHTDASFSWVVTNHKARWPRYNQYREELAARYHLAPRIAPEYFYNTVSQKSPPFFLQVGVMDGKSYDPIYPFIRHYGWKGILVEPLPDMLEKAKANYEGQPGLIFENVAITEQPEQRVIYRIRPEDLAAANLPHWVLGMSSFVEGKLDMYKEHVVEEKVTCIPLSALLEKHNPERIDVVQIDTEGYDYKIFRQFDLARYNPAIINLEFVNLPPEERATLQDTLMENGYVFLKHDLDLFAVKKQLVFLNL